MHQQRGIGQRLLDGRQVAIIAHGAAGDYVTANRLLTTTEGAEPWEHAVAACLTAAVQAWTGYPKATGLPAIAETYHRLRRNDDHPLFHVRLGPTAAALSAADDDSHRLGAAIEHTAIASGDAYAARETLAAPQIRLSDRGRETLSDLLRASGLGAKAIADRHEQHLKESVLISETAMHRALADHPADA